MTFDPARPRYLLPLDGRTYDLLGTFGLIEAVETALQQGVGVTAVRVVSDMTSHELAKLLSAILSANGHTVSPTDAGDILWGIGLVGEETAELRLHLYAFLSICLAKPSGREAVAKDMGELIGSLERGSPGATTSGSASASSAGRRPTSGTPRPGKSRKPTRATA